MSAPPLQDLPQIDDLQALPQKYQQLWITNKRLLKQINILKLEIGQKDRIIKQLKLEIDSTILQDTKNRLQYLRMIEDEVADKTKQVKEQFIVKMAQMQGQIENKISLLFRVQQELQKQRQQNKNLQHKFNQFKLHVIVALDEKDLLIRQLTNIINCQDKQVNYYKTKRQIPLTHQREAQKGLEDEKELKTDRRVSKDGKPSKVHIKRNV